MTNRVELLSPAGDMEKLRYAVLYGADAVYLSGKAFGMRTASGNFDRDELALAVSYCHARGVKVFVTVNIMPRPDDMAALPEYLAFLQDAQIDAIIAADLGVISMVRRYAPKVALHISTQASVVNHEAAEAYLALGARRVVLARELSLPEIAQIRAKTSKELELEVFVHGAMCISYSGRCLLSGYMAGRDSNRGNCAQPCRWQYRVVEEKRPGQYMPVFEDDRGTYIFNAKDMNMIAHLPQLIESGVSSLKIEGRVKTFYYTAVITNAYRRALDLYYADPQGYRLPEALAQEVHKVSHRRYGTGLYFGQEDSVYLEDSQYLRPWEVCAVVESCDADGNACLTQKNRFYAGEALELLMPGRDAIPITLTDMRDAEGTTIDVAPHPHMVVWAKLPVCAESMSLIRRKTN